jgi:hypothetical protein
LGVWETPGIHWLGFFDFKVIRIIHPLISVKYPIQAAEVRQRLQAGKITWTGPLTMLVARPVLFVFWQVVVAGLQNLVVL